jgi:hypothetical protein
MAPFADPVRPGRSRLEAAHLRLVPPRAGAASVAVVDGTRLYPAEDMGGGHMQAPTWVQQTLVWNGREAVTVDVSSLATGASLNQEPEALGRAVPGEGGVGLLLEQIRCEAPCRCRRPASLAAASKAFAEAARSSGCAVRTAPAPWPDGFALIDDDLTARTPTRDAAEARAAIPGDLGVAASVSTGIAEAIWRASRHGSRAPSFSGFRHWDLPDGGLELIGYVHDDAFLACVHAPTRASLHDAVRACAAVSGTSHAVLYARVDASGAVTEARHTPGSDRALRAIHRVAPGKFLLEEHAFRTAEARRPAWLSHALGWLVAGTPSFGSVTVTPRGDSVDVTVRRLECSAACPCPEPPAEPEAVPALLDALADDPRCEMASITFGG